MKKKGEKARGEQVLRGIVEGQGALTAETTKKLFRNDSEPLRVIRPFLDFSSANAQSLNSNAARPLHTAAGIEPLLFVFL